MIRCEHISFRAQGCLILDDVSAQALPGEITAVLGPNGAGKSTLLKCMSGLLKTGSGTVTLEGRPVEDYPPDELARKRAALAQSGLADFPFSALEVAHMGRSPHKAQSSPRKDFEVVKEAMKSLDVWHLRDRAFPTLSGGERQRVHLARALVQVRDTENACLLLDEPVSALDLKHCHKTFALLERMANEKGAAVCVVIHDLILAMRYAKTAIVMKNGKVISSGAVRRALSPENVSAVFEVPYGLVFPDSPRG